MSSLYRIGTGSFKMEYEKMAKDLESYGEKVKKLYGKLNKMTMTDFLNLK